MWSVVESLLSSILPTIIGPVFSNFKAYWRFYVPLLLVLLQLGTAYGWSHDHKLLVAERLAHQTDVTAWKAAQASAESKIIATKKDLEKKSKEKADAADKNYTTLLAKYRTSVLRYQANQSVLSRPGGDQQPQAPESGNGPSTGTNISISIEDANVCAVNTARLQAVHDWALSLP